MMTRDLIDAEVNNEDSYEDLLVSIEASEGLLSLLIAVCDDSNLREEIIKRYETELEPDLRSYRITLARGEPSLRGAIAQLVENDEYLQNGGRAVITVTGAEQLYFLKLGAERSEQDIFFGYLQWTREALREFPYPIVLWVTNQIVVNLSKKAPDFWSWRKGVFRFVSKKKAAVPSKEIASLPLSLALSDQYLSSIDEDNPHFLPIEDLQVLISQIEQQRGTKDPSLATLYYRMGQIYKRRIERGEAQDYKKEQELANEYFSKAAQLQKELGLESDLAYTLNELAVLYESQGRYQKVESLLMQASEIWQRLLGNEHLNVAISLNNLAALYKSQGRYQEAEPLLVQALELKQRLLGNEHPDVATSLNNLAALYRAQGRYQEAESLYIQALELWKRLLGEEHPNIATSLNNLAGTYHTQGRYQEAESLYIQTLELWKRLLGEEHPNIATSLNNLAGTYHAQGRYQEAELLLVQALELRQRLLGKEHPDVAASLNNLAALYGAQGRYQEAESLYIQALELHKHLLGEKHPDVAMSLNNLAGLYSVQGRYQEAEPLLLQALEICKQRLGVNHPNTVTTRNNLEILRTAIASK